MPANCVSSNVQRASFAVDELVDLMLSFYKRNYIEGLFLSSGVIRDADCTMEAPVRVARTLRETHDLRGYIHLKLIPEASPELAQHAGLWADRLSINVELPREESLTALAPEKEAGVIRRAMGGVRPPFVVAEDWTPGALTDSEGLGRRPANPEQPSRF